MSTADEPLARQMKFVDRPDAPIMFFDGTGVVNHFNGIIAVSISAGVWKPGPEGQIEGEVATVAHLRTNIQGAIALRDAINNALLLAAPAEGDAKN